MPTHSGAARGALPMARYGTVTPPKKTASMRGEKNSKSADSKNTVSRKS
jgi:hypothetical protein